MSAATGMRLFTILGAISTFENDLRKDRQMQGIALANTKASSSVQAFTVTRPNHWASYKAVSEYQDRRSDECMQDQQSIGLPHAAKAWAGAKSCSVNQIFNGPTCGETMWWRRKIPKVKNPCKSKIYKGFSFGGVDGTRTRDPRRDRPVF